MLQFDESTIAVRVPGAGGLWEWHDRNGDHRETGDRYFELTAGQGGPSQLRTLTIRPGQLGISSIVPLGPARAADLCILVGALANTSGAPAGASAAEKQIPAGQPA